jgi:hypothetical protein
VLVKQFFKDRQAPVNSTFDRYRLEPFWCGLLESNPKQSEQVRRA